MAGLPEDVEVVLRAMLERAFIAGAKAGRAHITAQMPHVVAYGVHQVATAMIVARAQAEARAAEAAEGGA